jgi:hypothetical protein
MDRIDSVRAEAGVVLRDEELEAVHGGTSGDADDRPTEEVAFYYNRIAFVRSKR